MSRPLPQLPKEVWTCIAFHTRTQLPNNSREVTERKQIRNVDLVNMMRSSKLLNNATAPALYDRVICDDIAGLHHNYKSDTPVAPGILSKRQLLHFTKALYLEYPIRELSEVQRENIISVRHLPPFGRSGSFTDEPAYATLIDSEMLFEADPTTQLQHSMPNLEVLSCATFFGTFENGWTTNFGGTLNFLHRVGNIQKVFTRMYLSGNVKHFCQSGNFNPLCLHPVELFTFVPPPKAIIQPSLSRTITLHVNLKHYKSTEYDGLFSSSSSLSDIRVRWCFDDPKHVRGSGVITPFLGFPDLPLFAKTIYSSMGSALAQRHEALNSRASPLDYPFLPINVDVYIPITEATAKMMLGDRKVTHMPKSTAKQKSMNRKITAIELLEEALIIDLLRTRTETKIIHPYDHLGVHYIADCPACPACSWVPIGTEA